MGSHWLETPSQSSKSKMCFVAFNSEQLEMKRKYWTRPLVKGGSCISQLRYAEPCTHTKRKQSEPPVAESKAFRCQPGRKSQQAAQKKCTAMQFSYWDAKYLQREDRELRTAKRCIVFCTGSVLFGLDCKCHIQWAWIIQSREIYSLLVYTEIHL